VGREARIPDAPKCRQITAANSCSGKYCAISLTTILTFLVAIAQYLSIAYMHTYPHRRNSYSLKILAISPYKSKILVPSCLQLHCFHRPEGEGVPGVNFVSHLNCRSIGNHR
jgi:hypothetical protein